jgi:hypothetical protein
VDNGWSCIILVWLRKALLTALLPILLPFVLLAMFSSRGSRSVGAVALVVLAFSAVSYFSSWIWSAKVTPPQRVVLAPAEPIPPLWTQSVTGQSVLSIVALVGILAYVALQRPKKSQKPKIG